MATGSNCTKSAVDSTKTVLKESEPTKSLVKTTQSELKSTNSSELESSEQILSTKFVPESSELKKSALESSELTKSALDSAELMKAPLESSEQLISTKSVPESSELKKSAQESVELTDTSLKLSEQTESVLKSSELAKSAVKLSELTKAFLESSEQTDNTKSSKSSSRLSETTVSPLESVLKPPTSVQGMKTLDCSLFTKLVTVPCFLVAGHKINQILKPIKPFLLKLKDFKSVYEDDTTPTKRWILLNPDRVKTMSDLDPLSREVLRNDAIEALQWKQVELKYENWKNDDILKAVLPDDREKSTAYSRIGHIVHLNLREHLTDYRYLIGQVLIDKLVGVTLVVNKTDTIDNTYRNFKMEVVAGDGTMIANVRENGCRFEFDFSEVFWNPRLSSEHERIVEKLPYGCVLYDVFCGVGPFAVPAARFKKCRVLANDLNPSSFKYLERNLELNKVKDRVTTYNMDGRKFIKEVIGKDMVKCRHDSHLRHSEFHVVMNLPAIAVEFLDAFRGLLSRGDGDDEKASKLPTVHCYMFCKGDEDTLRETAISMVESVLRERIDSSLTEVTHVRKVAPNKEMARVSFVLPNTVLFADTVEDGLEPPPKKMHLDDTI